MRSDDRQLPLAPPLTARAAELHRGLITQPTSAQFIDSRTCRLNHLDGSIQPAAVTTDESDQRRGLTKVF